MARARRDDNRIVAIIVESSDGAGTIIPLVADPVTSRLLVNSTITGSIEVAGLIPESYDYVSLTQATLTDVWTFYTGGSGGTLVATVTITYTDSGKETISNIART